MAKSYDQLVADNHSLQAELESLKRERAMLVEYADAVLEEARLGVLTLSTAAKLKLALSATEPQATQWLNDKLSAATEELHRKLAEQQALLMEVTVSGEECEFDDMAQYVMPLDTYNAVSDYVLEQTESCPELTAQLSAAKQQGYEQGKAFSHGESYATGFIAGMKAGRDEVLLEHKLPSDGIGVNEFLEKELRIWDLIDEVEGYRAGIAVVPQNDPVPYFKQKWLGLLTREEIAEAKKRIHPSAPIAATKGDKHE